MNDSELNQILKSARVPQRPVDYWERFPRHVVRRLRQEPVLAAPRRSRKPLLLIWAAGFATACLVIGFGIGFWNGRHHVSEGGSLTESVKLIREVAALFPHRVRAIISDDTGVRLVLSERADVSTSTPVLVKACQEKKCQIIITFSGQQVQLANKSFEILADVNGQVLLVGDHAVWTSAEPTRSLPDLKVQARVLEATL